MLSKTKVIFQLLLYTGLQIKILFKLAIWELYEDQLSPNVHIRKLYFDAVVVTQFKTTCQLVDLMFL